jgi:hypothetical protein
MRKAILLALGFAASSLLIRRGRPFGPASAVAVAGVLEEIARRLRNQSFPDQSKKPSLWRTRLARSKPPNAEG